MKNLFKSRRTFAIAVCCLSFAALLLAGCPTPVDDLTVPEKKNPQLTGTISVSVHGGGSAVTGATLVAGYSGTESVAYQWYKDGTAIAGATNATYMPTEAGSYTVTVSVTGYTSKTSAPITVTGASLPELTGNVTISPTENVTTGTELTAAYSGAESVTYLWNKDGALIPGAGGHKYIPAEAGSYTVTASATGFKEKTSAAVTVTGASLPDLTGNVTISPTANVTTGTELTAAYSGDEEVNWQWNRDGAAIDGETNAACTPTEPGAYTVTASATGYRSKTSDAVTVTLPALTGTLTISGSPVSGQTLTADVSQLNGTGTYSYQWKRGDTADEVNTDISGATVQTYTLAEADNGKYIAVTVHCTGYSGSVTSAALGPVTAIIVYTVTFNKNHSDTTGWTEANPQTVTVTAPATTVVSLPQSPTRTNSAFIGWNTQANGGGTAFTTATTVTANIIVYAQWQQWPEGSLFVTSGADSGAGTLREKIEDAPAGGTVVIESSVGTISLASRLSIGKNITIMGNGTTVTRAASWTATDANSQLIYVSSANAEVNISRIHFNGGRATTGGAAISNTGSLTVDSCIFSDNQTSVNSATGGAVYNASGGVLRLRGCTFYNNKSGYRGGAVYNSGSLRLTGNLFYGNTASTMSNGPAVYSDGGTVTSYGYNAVDLPLGTGGGNSGWASESGDATISGLPITPITFRLLSGRGAAGVLTSLPSGYPNLDFYGSPIAASAAAPGAAGAVQAIASGYYLDVTVNNAAWGSVTALTPNADGLYSDPVTLTASATTGSFWYWLVNGARQNSNPLTVTFSGHTIAQAVFISGRLVTVDNNGDSAITPGTLRYALTNAQAGDVISFNAAYTVELGSALPQITTSITIEGNGSTLTRASSWTTINSSSQLLYVNSSSASVDISRLHFKDGRATDYGAAIRNDGVLTLESCIFSGNQTSGSSPSGGAVYNNRTMNLRGCTFYNNKSGYRGGAVYNSSGNLTLTLAGNLFYGNTASQGPAVYWYSGNVTSQGYNVVDVDLGTVNSQSGWSAATGDKTISGLPISPVTFRLLPDSGAAGALTSLPSNYPLSDFYGSPIAAGGAAGAVQSPAAGSGYYLDLRVNDAVRGSASASPAPDAEGLYSVPVTLTASAASGYVFSHWLINGVRENANPLTVTLNSQTVARPIFIYTFTVNSTGDSATTVGTLRYALTNAQEGDIIRFSDAYTIAPGSDLPYITTSVTIEGNGSTIRGSCQLIINSSSAVVQISRLHFKDGRNFNRRAIFNIGNLTLESCIFSGNQTSGDGGAIYNSGTMNLRGCTFYNNRSDGWGGAVYNGSNSTLIIVGNLFYGNTAAVSKPAVSSLYGGITSNGYNVVDLQLGTIYTNSSGWEGATGDKTISGLPISPVTFRLLPNSGAAGALTSLPSGYPSLDFYGNPIAAGGAAGAVQSPAAGSGYYLDLRVSDAVRGSASASFAPDAEGLYSSPVTLTASALSDYVFSHWLVNGVKESANPFTVPMSDHTVALAVFTYTFTVTGTGDNATTAGTLRYALTNAQDGDIIRFNGAYTISLGSALPQITKSITIEGNGSTITRASTWTESSNNSQLLIISSGTVNISRLRFSNGRADYGGAIRNNGTLTLESCIFSGNQASNSSYGGGAVINGDGKTLHLRGCTFYNNSGSFGGAVFNGSYGTLTLEGNLFSGNTSTSSTNPRPVIGNNSGTIISNGYNVVNVAFGTDASQCGWDAHSTDTTFSNLGITGVSFNTTTFAPVAGLKTVMPSTPIADFPTTDFNGATRDWPGAPGAVK